MSTLKADTISAVTTNGDLTLSGNGTGGITFSGDLSVGDDLTLGSDSAVLNFGADSDITITHSADTGLILKNTHTSGNSGIGAVLTLQTGDTDVADGNILGHIKFQAPDEGAGTDAILIAAAIAAESEGDFSSSNNATSLVFQTGASEAATTKMTLTSGGNLDVTGTIQGTTITAETAVVPDASDGAALGTTSLEWSDLYLADGAVLGFGDDQDVTLTHVADTGLILKNAHTSGNSGIGAILTLQTGDTDMADGNVMGHIKFHRQMRAPRTWLCIAHKDRLG